MNTIYWTAYQIDNSDKFMLDILAKKQIYSTEYFVINTHEEFDSREDLMFAVNDGNKPLYANQFGSGYKLEKLSVQSEEWMNLLTEHENFVEKNLDSILNDLERVFPFHEVLLLKIKLFFSRLLNL